MAYGLWLMAYGYGYGYGYGLSALSSFILIAIPPGLGEVMGLLRAGLLRAAVTGYLIWRDGSIVSWGIAAR